jgi:hypothetical protein
MKKIYPVSTQCIAQAREMLYQSIGLNYKDTIHRNPVTGTEFIPSMDCMQFQIYSAAAALQAQDVWLYIAPEEFGSLPLTYGDREKAKTEGTARRITGWFARSLESQAYKLALHPSIEVYAAGVMASPLTPDEVTMDAAFARRYPPRVLPGLGGGLCWSPKIKGHQKH